MCFECAPPLTHTNTCSAQNGPMRWGGGSGVLAKFMAWNWTHRRLCHLLLPARARARVGHAGLGSDTRTLFFALAVWLLTPFTPTPARSHTHIKIIRTRPGGVCICNLMLPYYNNIIPWRTACVVYYQQFFTSCIRTMGMHSRNTPFCLQTGREFLNTPFWCVWVFALDSSRCSWDAHTHTRIFLFCRRRKLFIRVSHRKLLSRPDNSRTQAHTEIRWLFTAFPPSLWQFYSFWELMSN